MFIPGHDKQFIRLILVGCLGYYLGILRNQIKGRITIPDEHWIRTQMRETELIWGRAKQKREAALHKCGPFFEKQPWGTYHENGMYLHTFWDFFAPIYSCPLPVDRVGPAGDGGYRVCGFARLVQKPGPCTVYSYGISTDIGFEQEVLERTNCTVRMFDFTIDQTIGPAPDLVRRYHQRAQLYKIGLGSENIGNLRTLRTEMTLHNDTFLDILKIDCEGCEFGGISRIVKDFPDGLPFAQLPMELHVNHASQGLKANDTYLFKELVAWFNLLDVAGLRAFFQSANSIQVYYDPLKAITIMEYAFFNSKVGPEYFRIDPNIESK